MNTIKKMKYQKPTTIWQYIFVSIVVLVVIAITIKVQACDPTTDSSCQPAGGAANPGITITSGIKNPLGNTITDLPSFIVIILNFVFLVGVPIIALAIIYAGFLFVTAQGNERKLTKAKQTLLFTLIGAALILGSYVIANAIRGTVQCIKDNSTTCN
jgi:hypothetical protein